MKAEIAQLKFELDNLKRVVFGRTSERFVAGQQAPSEQLNMFAEAMAEQEAKAAQAEVVKEHIEYERNKPVNRKKHPGRTPLPEHLRVEETVIEPDCDTTDMVHIGDEITDQLAYTPADLYIERTIRPKYARRSEQPEEEEQQTSPIVIAELPPQPIAKSIATASLLAHIIIAKFVDHLPFYR